MDRKCKLLRPAVHRKTAIYIDSINSKEILDYIKQDKRHKRKFNDIVEIVLENLHNNHLYKMEKIDKNVKNIWAMRFFVGQENDRIYCKEIGKDGTKMVIMGILHLSKKNDKLNAKQKAEITTLSNYEYEIESWK